MSTTEVKEKMAPVQGYTPGIPWSLHLEAYDAYRKKYGAQPALIDLEGRNCRGGFGVAELDMFIPGWRDKVSEIGKLRARVKELETKLADLDGTAYSWLDKISKSSLPGVRVAAQVLKDYYEGA